MTNPEFAQSLLNIILRLLLQHQTTTAQGEEDYPGPSSSSRRTSGDNISTKSSTPQTPVSSSDAAAAAGSDIVSVMNFLNMLISNGSLDSKALALNNPNLDPGGQPDDKEEEQNDGGDIPKNDDTSNPIVQRFSCCLLEHSSKNMSFVVPSQIIASNGNLGEKLGSLLVIPVTDDINDPSATSPLPHHNWNTPLQNEYEDQMPNHASSIEEQLPENVSKVNKSDNNYCPTADPSNNETTVQRKQKDKPN